MVVDVGLGAAVFGDLLQEPVPAVGIHHRIYQNHQLVQQALDWLALGSGEVIHHRQCRVRAGGFVAVDRIGQPGGAREAGDERIGLAVTHPHAGLPAEPVPREWSLSERGLRAT